MISLCCLISCQQNEEQLTDGQIEQIAQQQFRTLRDTLTKQYDAECDSLFDKYVG